MSYDTVERDAKGRVVRVAVITGTDAEVEAAHEHFLGKVQVEHLRHRETDCTKWTYRTSEHRQHHSYTRFWADVCRRRMEKHGG